MKVLTPKPIALQILESLTILKGGEPRDTDTDRPPFYPELVDDDLDLDRPDPADLDLRDPLKKVTVNESHVSADDIVSQCMDGARNKTESQLRANRLIKKFANELDYEDLEAIQNGIDHFWGLNESGPDCTDPAASDDDLSGDLLAADIALLTGAPVVDTSEEGAAAEIEEARRRRRRINENDGHAPGDKTVCNDLTSSELAQIVIDSDDNDLRDPLEMHSFSENGPECNPYDDQDLSDDEIAALLVADAVGVDERDPLAVVTVNESFVAHAVQGGLAAAGLGGMAQKSGEHSQSAVHHAKSRVSKMSAATKKAISDGVKKAWKSGKRKLGIHESAEDPYECTDLSDDELAQLLLSDDDLDLRDPLDKVSVNESAPVQKKTDHRAPRKLNESNTTAGKLLEAFTHFAPDLIYTPEEDITTGQGETAISIASKGHALHIDGRPSHDVNSYLAQSKDHDQFTADLAMLDRPDVDIGVDDFDDGYQDLHESIRRIQI